MTLPRQLKRPARGADDAQGILAQRIGENLKKARKMRRLSQRALGERAGISYKQLQKYEQGRRIRADALWEIAKVLDVPIETFFQGQPAEPQPGMVSGQYLHLAELGEHARRVVLRVKELDADVLSTLDDLLARLVDKSDPLPAQPSESNTGSTKPNRRPATAS